MKLLLTKSADPDFQFAKKLERAGFQTVSLPLIVINPPHDKGKKLQKKMGEDYDWLVVTSVSAAKAVAPFLKKKKPHFKIAAVGSVTANVLKSLGYKVIVPKKSGGAAELVRFFKGKKMQGKKFLYPASSIARDVLKTGLEKMGAKVDLVIAYQTVFAPQVSKKLKAILKKGIDGILFFSPSAVDSFARIIKPSAPILKTISLYSYGKTTAQALRKKKYKRAILPIRV